MPEFDLVAPVYDATRPPPSAEELAAVRSALEGARTVLETGVGTGRYSVPLSEHGLRMTGVDISLEMMRLARSKGLERLVRADLHHLPFRDAGFDATLIVHVLQLIPDPFVALAELARVSRDRVVAVFPEPSHAMRERREGFRKRYRELAAARGYPLPERSRYWENGARLLAAWPPDRVVRVESTEPPDPERRRRWEDLRAFGGLVGVPEEVHREIVAQIRAERGDRPPTELRGPRSHTIAVWSAARRAELGRLLRSGGMGPSEPPATG